MGPNTERMPGFCSKVIHNCIGFWKKINIMNTLGIAMFSLAVYSHTISIFLKWLLLIVIILIIHSFIQIITYLKMFILHYVYIRYVVGNTKIGKLCFLLTTWNGIKSESNLQNFYDGSNRMKMERLYLFNTKSVR